MSVYEYPSTTLVLVAASDDQFIPITPPLSTLNARRLVQGVVRIDSMQTNFRCRLAVRKCINQSSWDRAVGFLSTDLDHWVVDLGIVGEKMYSVDPNTISTGKLSEGVWFQIGVTYGLTLDADLDANGIVTVEGIACV